MGGFNLLSLVDRELYLFSIYKWYIQYFFTTFDIMFVLGSMFIAVIFGLNSYAHGRLTPVIDGILSLIFYACTFYAIYNYGIVSGLALYYIMIEVVGYIQRR